MLLEPYLTGVQEPWPLFPAGMPRRMGKPRLQLRVTQVLSLALEGNAPPQNWGLGAKSVAAYQPCPLGINIKPFKVDDHPEGWGALGCFLELISAT